MRFIAETKDHLALSRLFADSGLEVQVSEETPEGVVKMWRCEEEDGELLGGAVLQEKDGRFILKDLAVKDGCRRSGIGKALLLRVYAEAQARGAEEIWGCAKVPEYYAAKGWSIVPDEDAPQISDCQTCGQYLTVCFPKIIIKRF